MHFLKVSLEFIPLISKHKMDHGASKVIAYNPTVDIEYYPLSIQCHPFQLLTTEFSAVEHHCRLGGTTLIPTSGR